MHIPDDSSSPITVFARTDFRDRKVPFGIRRDDRRSHLYLLGKTGTGKSTLLETLMTDDLKKGEGFALLDPHGDLVKKMYGKAMALRPKDVLYFDAPNQNQPFGVNPLAPVAPALRPLAASGLVQVFKHLWPDSWGPRLEHLLRHALLALLDYPQATLADLPALLTDREFRRRVIQHSTNAAVADFWIKEYENYPARLRLEAISPLQNKIGAFLAHPLLRRILTGAPVPLKLRQVMDDGKILLVNLAKGSLGEDVSNLLGSLLVSRFDLAALSRSNIPERKRKLFYLYADEFHNFTTDNLASMLSELRKYNLSLTLANQFLAQLAPAVREAMLGNVGTLIAFRLGATDAALLAPEFAPEIAAADLVNLPNHRVYLKMMIGGRISRPFSAETLDPDSSSA